MSEAEKEARIILQISGALMIPTITACAPLMWRSNAEFIHGFVKYLRDMATEIEEQARVIDGTVIDSIIERSKSK